MNFAKVSKQVAVQLLEKSKGNKEVALDLALEHNEAQAQTTKSQQTVNANVDMNSSTMNDT